jgi:hypothetical protein
MLTRLPTKALSAEPPTHQLDERGEYICDACGERYVEPRYTINVADGLRHGFCLPECLVAFDYYGFGHFQDDKESVAISKQFYTESFKRHVVPTPMSVLLRNDTRPRSQWLFEACRRPDQLTPEDAARAKLELQLQSK